MKVAIITITNGANYGNRLQNYATQYFIEKNFNCHCETLHNNSSTIIYSLRKKLKKERKTKRDRNFQKFNEQYINFSHHTITNWSREKKYKNYDLFICGSDQIWNSSFKENDKANFGYFIKSKPVISFSASFGIDNIIKEKEKNYKKYLKHLTAISVREEKGKEIIKNVTGLTSEVLLDPTMLLQQEEWEKISHKPKNFPRKKYILTYFLGTISKERKIKIEIFAKQNNYEIVSLMDKNNEYYELGPSEFLYLEEHAELILTDSFHSAVFAILFSTPFLVFEREDKMKNMNSRIETLLTKFHLEKHIFSSEIEKIPVEKEKIASILEKEKRKSLQFLEKYLKEE